MQKNERGFRVSPNPIFWPSTRSTLRPMWARPGSRQRLNISGSDRLVSRQIRSLHLPFLLSAPARQPARDLSPSASQDLSRQRLFGSSSEEASHDIRMPRRDSV